MQKAWLSQMQINISSCSSAASLCRLIVHPKVMPWVRKSIHVSTSYHFWKGKRLERAADCRSFHNICCPPVTCHQNIWLQTPGRPHHFVTDLLQESKILVSQKLLNCRDRYYKAMLNRLPYQTSANILFWGLFNRSHAKILAIQYVQGLTCWWLEIWQTTLLSLVSFPSVRQNHPVFSLCDCSFLTAVQELLL